MKKLAFSLLFAGTFLGLFLNASDFKSMDNKQLLEQAGKVAPSEVPEFRAEVNKRLKAMKEEDRKNYKADFKKEKFSFFKPRRSQQAQKRNS